MKTIYLINAYNTIMKTKLLTILLLLLCIAPSIAMPYGTNITSDNWSISNQTHLQTDYPVYYYTMQDQIVLNALTKQNDLLEELIKAQWVETCYVPSDNNIIRNRSAWQSECAKAGYPVG